MDLTAIPFGTTDWSTVELYRVRWTDGYRLLANLPVWFDTCANG